MMSFCRGHKKRQSKRYKACSDVECRNSIDAAASRFAPKPNRNPALAVVIWRGGARERADDVFFCQGHKKTSEQSGLCSDVEHRNTIDAISFFVNPSETQPCS